MKNQPIMVINKNLIFKNYFFEGFCKKEEHNFLDIIIKNHEWMKRDIAESNYSYKQPIAYAIILNPKEKKLFLYQRPSNNNERRLKNLYSLGIGGHIEKQDKTKNPILSSLLRELKEEVSLSSFTCHHLGYINEEINDVCKVHFGILYLIKTLSEVKPKNKETENGSLVPIKKINELIKTNALESWSKISFNALTSLNIL